IQIIKASPQVDVKFLVAIGAVVIAPMFEELLFRGHLQSTLAGLFRIISMKPNTTDPEPAWPRWTAICITALLFPTVHYAGPGSGWMLPALFLLAVCLGYAYERTGVLWVPIVGHAAFNAVSVSVVFLGGASP